MGANLGDLGRWRDGPCKWIRSTVDCLCKKHKNPRMCTETGHHCQLTCTDLQGSDMEGWKRNISSWSECGQLCMENEECKSFTWFAEDYTIDTKLRLQCNIKKEVPSPSKVKGLMSGTKACLEQKDSVQG